MGNKNHDKWMANELKRIRKAYRDALLHASFIEGVVIKISKSSHRDFYHAIKWLHIHKKIKDKERVLLDNVRNARNKLVHDIIKEEASQKEIEQWRDDLVDKIMKAYRKSAFLKKELLTRIM